MSPESANVTDSVSLSSFSWSQEQVQLVLLSATSELVAASSLLATSASDLEASLSLSATEILAAAFPLSRDDVPTCWDDVSGEWRIASCRLQLQTGGSFPADVAHSSKRPWSYPDVQEKLCCCCCCFHKTIILSQTFKLHFWIVFCFVFVCLFVLFICFSF